VVILNSLKFKNFYWLFSDKIIKIPFALILSALLARYLGPANLGTIIYSISFYGIFSFLINTGMEEIITRDLIIHPIDTNKIIGSGIFLKFIFGLTSTFLTIITSYFFFENINEFYYIILVSLSGLFYFPYIIESYYHSKYQSKIIVKISLVIFLASTLFKVIGIILSAPIIFFIIFSPLEIIITALFYCYLIRYNLKFKFFIFDYLYLVKLFKDTLPLIISGMAVSLYMKIDQIMIKSIMGNTELGLFSVGIRFVENLYFIPMVITSSFLPNLVESKLKSEEEYYISIYILSSTTLYICIALSIILFFLSDYLILFLFGVEYFKSIDVLKIYGFTLIFTALGVSSSRWLVVENKQNLSLYRTFLGLGLNLVLNYIWIPKYGAIGAAWASIISNSFSSFLFYSFLPSTWFIFKVQLKSFNIFPLISYYKQ
jgi:O-antigen/teichoic acid export membrane protein